MWGLRVCLSLALLATTSLSAQDRFVALHGHVFRVAADDTLAQVMYAKPGEDNLRFGSTEARISPDQRWVAWIGDNSVWLRSTSGRPAVRIAAGKPAQGRFGSVDVFLVGFTPDSRHLLYSVAPGGPACFDCEEPPPAPQEADYGFFLYDIASSRAVKKAVPESTRVLDIVGPDRLFIANIGPYGDQLGFMDFPAQTFRALPQQCAAASACTVRPDARHPACMAVTGGSSHIVECDTGANTARNASPVGRCAKEFQQPLRSPDGKHLAFAQRTRNCTSDSLRLWIDRQPRFECKAFSGYAWIDDARLLLGCGDQATVIDLAGRRLSSAPLDAPPQGR